MKRKNEYGLVEVVWVDATHLNKSPDLEIIEKHGLMYFSNVGYLILENDELIAICSAILEEGRMKYESEDNFRDVLLIPKGMIKKITKLKKVGSR